MTSNPLPRTSGYHGLTLTHASTAEQQYFHAIEARLVDRLRAERAEEAGRPARQGL